MGLTIPGVGIYSGSNYAFQEWAQSQGVTEEEIGDDSSGVVRVFNVPWNTRQAWAKSMIGFAQRQVSANSSNVLLYVDNDLAQTDADNPKVVYSDSWPFTGADVGRQITITGGTGWTPGNYTIVSVSPGGFVILDNAPAPGPFATNGAWELFGTVTARSPFIQRFTPQPEPEWEIEQLGVPRGPYMFARSIRMRGLAPLGEINPGQSITIPNYKQTRATVRYETLPYDILTDKQMTDAGYKDAAGNPDESTWKRYVIKIVRPAGEFFTIPSKNATGPNPGDVRASYYYVATAPGTSVIHGIGKLIIYANLVITQVGVPEMCVPSMHVNPTLTGPAALEMGLGRVNALPFNNYPVGTMLLSAVELRPRRSAFGGRIYDITTYIKFFQPKLGGTLNVPNSSHQHILWSVRPGGADWTEISSHFPNPATNFSIQAAAASIYDYFSFVLLYRSV